MADVEAQEIARNLMHNGGITKDQAAHALDVVNANILVLAKYALLSTQGAGAWQPLETVPEFVRNQASFHRPRLGELIYQNVNDADGSVWVIQYDNPSTRPLRAYKLPSPAPAPTPHQNSQEATAHHVANAPQDDGTGVGPWSLPPVSPTPQAAVTEEELAAFFEQFFSDMSEHGWSDMQLARAELSQFVVLRKPQGGG